MSCFNSYFGLQKEHTLHAFQNYQKYLANQKSILKIMIVIFFT